MVIALLLFSLFFIPFSLLKMQEENKINLLPWAASPSDMSSLTNLSLNSSKYVTVNPPSSAINKNITGLKGMGCYGNQLIGMYLQRPGGHCKETKSQMHLDAWPKRSWRVCCDKQPEPLAGCLMTLVFQALWVGHNCTPTSCLQMLNKYEVHVRLEHQRTNSCHLRDQNALFSPDNSHPK